MSEQDDRPSLSAEQLTDRFRRLAPGDPQRLREDIDATVDQRLPGTGSEEDDR